MPKTRPQDGDINWGETLNQHLAQLQGDNGGINTAASDPTLTSDDEGYTYVNTSSNELRQWDGSSWSVLLQNISEADLVVYDNSTSGLSATDTQAAIDEINTKVEAGLIKMTGTTNVYISGDSGAPGNPGTEAQPLSLYSDIQDWIETRDFQPGSLLIINYDATSTTSFSGDFAPTMRFNGTSFEVQVAIYNGTTLTAPIDFNLYGDFASNSEADIRNLDLGTVQVRGFSSVVIQGCTAAGPLDVSVFDSLAFFSNTLNGGITRANFGTKVLVTGCTFNDQRLLITDLTFGAEFRNVTLDGPNSEIYIRDSFFNEFNNLTLTGATRTDSSDPIIHLESSASTYITGTLDLNNNSIVKLLEFIRVSDCFIDWEYTNVSTTPSTLSSASPIILEDSTIRFASPTILSSQTPISVDLFNITGNVHITSFSETFGNLPFSYTNNGLPAGTIVNLADAFEINYNNSDSELTADNVKAGLDELDERTKYVYVNSNGSETPVVTGTNAVGAGLLTEAEGQNGVAIGFSCGEFNSNGIAIGNACKAGDGDTIPGFNGVAIGNQCLAHNNGTIAIGNQAEVTGVNSVQLGNGTNSTSNTLQFRSTPVANDTSIQLATQSTGSAPTSTPPDGTMIVDQNGNGTLWIRVSGAWKSTTLI